MIRALTAAAFVATAPLAPALAAVEIQEVVSPGGITAWLVEEPSIPFVAIELQFEGGAGLDLPGKRGATFLMHGLLEEGAGARDNVAFAEAVEELSARFSFEAFADSVTVSAQMLTDETLDDAVALLRDAITDPIFDPAAVERVRGQVQSIIEANASDPGEIASAAQAASLFPDHPYGSGIEGTRESVAALTPADLAEAHRNAMRRDNVIVGVTGDITPEELGPLLDDLLGGLPETGPEGPGRADMAEVAGIDVIEFPAPQSTVRWAQGGIGLDDPDYFAAILVNHVLGGGGFGSRLTEEVRVERGLTYGIGTGLAPRDHAEQWLGSFSASNDKVAEAIDVVLDEWSRMATEGLTEEELEAAKTYVMGAYPLRFDGNARIAGILAGMQSIGLPIDYIPTRNDRVEAVTLEQANRVARELLTPDQLSFVVVGQPEGVEDGPLPADG
ncbi:insulinase family protein [Jannaschia sp. Os4]|uniref:M16 family metallopeptidase n=1 Tax=Jannaschia sp. Os4 TaxID=2807617 RepID=UPI00193A9E08|nr:pitrilysin family protein [Jannaschia sp. Os4]MBM2574805.1 insulinase family protein [Jannaschia sp. Os4]